MISHVISQCNSYFTSTYFANTFYILQLSKQHVKIIKTENKNDNANGATFLGDHGPHYRGPLVKELRKLEALQMSSFLCIIAAEKLVLVRGTVTRNSLILY